jgi:chromosome segregation ATPase
MMLECEKRRRKLSETSDELREELKAARESADQAQRGEREAESRYAKAVESLGQVRDAVSKESQSDEDVARLIKSAEDAQQAVNICEASLSEIQGQLSEARSLNSTLRGQLDDEKEKVTSLRRDMEAASELVRDLQDKEALAQVQEVYGLGSRVSGFKTRGFRGARLGAGRIRMVHSLGFRV